MKKGRKEEEEEALHNVKARRVNGRREGKRLFTSLRPKE